METDTHIIQEAVLRIWNARESRSLSRDPVKLSRELALAIADEVRSSEGYDPDLDVRVLWSRELIAVIRRTSWAIFPRASRDAEYACAYLIGKLDAPVASGKDRAAGNAA
jgi:hypothetical protein